MVPLVSVCSKNRYFNRGNLCVQPILQDENDEKVKPLLRTKPWCEVDGSIASSPGRQLKFGKKDGLVSIATPLVRMRWPLPEKVVIVYFACKPFRKLTRYRSASF